MKTWYKVTEIPSDVLLEWELAFIVDKQDLKVNNFEIQAIYQAQRKSIITSLPQGDASRKYLEMFYLT